MAFCILARSDAIAAEELLVLETRNVVVSPFGSNPTTYDITYDERYIYVAPDGTVLREEPPGWRNSIPHGTGTAGDRDAYLWRVGRQLIYAADATTLNSLVQLYQSHGFGFGDSFVWNFYDFGVFFHYREFVPAPTGFTLTVESANPASGVSITVSPSDKNNAANGSTTFTRTYNGGTVVTLTAPAAVNGKRFVKWSRDGVDQTTANTTTVTMDKARSMKAIYLVASADPQVSFGGCPPPGFSVPLTVHHYRNVSVFTNEFPLFYEITYEISSFSIYNNFMLAAGTSIPEYEIRTIQDVLPGQVDSFLRRNGKTVVGFPDTAEGTADRQRYLDNCFRLNFLSAGLYEVIANNWCGDLSKWPAGDMVAAFRQPGQSIQRLGYKFPAVPGPALEVIFQWSGPSAQYPGPAVDLLSASYEHGSDICPSDAWTVPTWVLTRGADLRSPGLAGVIPHITPQMLGLQDDYYTTNALAEGGLHVTPSLTPLKLIRIERFPDHQVPFVRFTYETDLAAGFSVVKPAALPQNAKTYTFAAGHKCHLIYEYEYTPHVNFGEWYVNTLTQGAISESLCLNPLEKAFGSSTSFFSRGLSRFKVVDAPGFVNWVVTGSVNGNLQEANEALRRLKDIFGHYHQDSASLGFAVDGGQGSAASYLEGDGHALVSTSAHTVFTPSVPDILFQPPSTANARHLNYATRSCDPVLAGAQRKLDSDNLLEDMNFFRFYGVDQFRVRLMGMAPRFPAIMYQPHQVMIKAGERAFLSINVDPLLLPSFKWYRGESGNTTSPVTSVSSGVGYFSGADYPGTNSWLVTAPLNESTTYWVQVTNIYGFTNSQTIQVIVSTAPDAGKPSVSAVVSPVTAERGTVIELHAPVSGSHPIYFQWYRGAQLLSNATNDFLIITNSTPADAGTYSVIVSNAYGSVTGTVATVTVQEPLSAPVIMLSPTNQTVPAGVNVSLTVNATGYPLSYQWKKDGVILSNVLTGILTLATVTELDAGVYEVSVFNEQGAVFAKPFRLTVEAPPRIIAQPPSPTNEVGANVLLSVVAGGSPPLAYQWRKNGSPLFYGRISGFDTSTLTLFKLQIPDAGNYDVVITNRFGAVTSAVARVSMGTGVTPLQIAQQAYLKASNTGTNDYFGYAVAIAGDTIVVGAPNEGSSATGVNGTQSNNSATNAGAAYVFVRNGTTWTQQAYLKASNTGTNDQFGAAVAISGDTIIVGAYGEASSATGVNGTQSNNSATNAGAAYVFVRNGTTWTQQAYLKASNTGANDRFGSAVGISGETLVVGSPGEASNVTGVNGNQANNSATKAGAAYVFVRSGVAWAQQAYLKASNTAANDEFGSSVAVSADTVAIGAPKETGIAEGVNGTQQRYVVSRGAAYIFIRTGSSWTQQAYLKPFSYTSTEYFGAAISLAGDTVVVGAHWQPSSDTGVNGNQTMHFLHPSGAVYVFVRGGTDWREQAFLKASNSEIFDYFGYSVAVSGGIVVAGAPVEDSNATGINGDQANNNSFDPGAVYVFTGDMLSFQQPRIIRQPEDQSAPAGSAAAFSVTASSTTPLSFQWRENGLPLTEGVVSGMRDSTLSLVNLQLTDAGNYDVILTNQYGSVTSVVAQLTVEADFTPLQIAQQAYLKASNAGAADDFGYAVAVAGDTVVVGAYSESSSAPGVNGNQSNNSMTASGAAYVFVRNGTTWTQQAYLKASNPGADDNFGWSVAISGNTIIVGARDESSSSTGVNGSQNNDNANRAGAVYVFVRNGTTWTQQAYLKASNAGAGDRFGHSIAISGDTVLVGAYVEASSATGVNGSQSNNNAPAAGAAYVFVRSGTTWTQQAYLKASNTGAGDFFGYSVALAGDTAAVGGRDEDSNATGVNGNQSNNSALEAGAAYVFTRSGTTWTQQAYLKASNTGSGDYFGTAVALSGNTLLVGARGEASTATGVNGSQGDDSAPSAGAAYVFVRNGSTWTQQAYLKAGHARASALFGIALSLSGDAAVVGSYSEASRATGINGYQKDTNAVSSGAAYVFVRSGATWYLHSYLKASNTDPGDLFGDAVAISGDTIVVGATDEDSSASGINGNQADNSFLNAGAAYIITGNFTALQTPRIIQEPLSRTNQLSTPASFSVLASSSLPLAYQWRKGGVNLTGATNALLTLNSVQRIDSGYYSVAVTNTAGSVTSTNALLLVRAPQQILPLTSLGGGRYRISFSDLGGGLLYAWDLNQLELQGSTDLASTNWVTLTNSVAISNGIGTVEFLITNIPPRQFYRIRVR